MLFSLPRVLLDPYSSRGQGILAPFTAARSALHEFLSASVCAGGSVEGPDSGGSSGRMKTGDWRGLFGRLPRECARAYFLAIPQVIAPAQARRFHSVHWIVAEFVDNEICRSLCDVCAPLSLVRTF